MGNYRSISAPKKIDLTKGAQKQASQSNGGVQFPNRIERILVPTDLTDDNEGAIEAGIILARSFGAKLTLLYVYDVNGILKYRI